MIALNHCTLPKYNNSFMINLINNIGEKTGEKSKNEYEK